MFGAGTGKVASSLLFNDDGSEKYKSFNFLLRFIKGAEFLAKLRSYKRLKKVSLLYNYLSSYS
jgi:hypothetical protein